MDAKSVLETKIWEVFFIEAPPIFYECNLIFFNLKYYDCVCTVLLIIKYFASK